MKIKNLHLMGILLLLFLFSISTSCSNNSVSNKNISSNQTHKSLEKESKKSKNDLSTSQKDTNSESSNNGWSFKNDVLETGKLSFKFTKSEIHDSDEDNINALVIFMDITNNFQKEISPEDITDNFEAEQKTETANKQLNSVYHVSDDDPDIKQIEKQHESLVDKLLPGKTTHAVLIYELNNKNPVTLTLNNKDYDKIGQKVFDVSN